VPYAAVVYADRSPAGHAETGWFWSTDVRQSTLGAFAACLYGHVQVSSVPELILDQPETLSRYRVLYLADVPHLSPQRVANIQRFVAEGGGLLASYATSLYGPAGERLDRFGLEDLLRVRPVRAEGDLADTLASYRCMTGGPDDLYLQAHGEVRTTANAGRMIPLWHFVPVETLDGGTVRTDIVTGDGHRPILPGVVASRFGKGRVIYLASSLESLYNSTRQSLLGGFLRTLVVQAAGEPPPSQVDAPPSLIANLTQNGDRRVLHLLNWTGDAENEANYLPPVSNVTVRIAIPEGMKVRRVSTFLETPLRTRQVDHQLEIRLARVEAYQAVVVEFAGRGHP
jgi:hypothetical protein